MRDLVGRAATLFCVVAVSAACTSESDPASGATGASGAAGSSAGAAGSGTAGAATAGSGTAGSGTAGAATAGSGTAGSGTTGAWGPELCPAAESTGFQVGQAVGALPVQDCDTGEMTTIDVACGASATWIFAAHTHCPTCKATAGFTDEVAAAVSSKNVAVLHTVYDDSGTSCAAWRTAYGLAGVSNVRVFNDPGGKVWAALKTSNYTAPSAFLNAQRVVTYKEHGLSKASVLQRIDEALAQ